MKPTTRNTVNLYCLKNRITLQELAFKLGVSLDEAETLLDEKTVVKAKYLDTLCELFNCKPEDLIL